MTAMSRSRLEYGVRLRPHHLVRPDVSLASAQALVAESEYGAVVMVREHDIGEWMPLDFYEKYGAPHPEDTEARANQRRQLYDMQQYWDLRGQIFRLQVQLNSEYESIPLVLIKDLPTEWRSMMSLTVEDVARELETIIKVRRERHTTRRVVPEAKLLPSEGELVHMGAGSYRKSFGSAEHAMAHLAMAKAALAEYERRELDPDAPGRGEESTPTA